MVEAQAWVQDELLAAWIFQLKVFSGQHKDTAHTPVPC